MARRGWFGVLVLVCVAVCALVAQPAQAQTELKWKFKEGDKFHLETVTDMKQTIMVMGINQQVDMKTTQLVSMNVKKKASDGTVVLEQKIDSMKVEGGQIAQLIGPTLQKMEGAVLTLHLSPDHKVTKVEGFKEMLNKVVGDDPMAQQFLKGAINEDAMKQQFEMTFSFLPDKPVRTGDKWERTSNVSLGPLGSFATKANYTYDGKETLNGKPLDKISSAMSLIYAPPKADAAGALPFKITKGDLKGESPKSTYWFDSAAGRLVQHKTNMKFAGSLTAEVMGNTIEMMMDQNQDITVRMIDKTPLEK